MKKTTRKLLAVLMAAALLLGAVPGALAAEPEASVTFTFTDEGITAVGGEDGYEIKGTALTVNASGTYLVTGACSEGSVSVKKGTTGVTLVLKDLTLTSSTTAPVAAKKNTETTLYIAGSVTLTNKEDVANEESDDFEGAAIKAKSGSTLTITGDGVLIADGSTCKNGIKGGAETTITVEDGVTVNIKAAKNGLASDGAVVINGGTLNIEAVGDGIKSEPEEDDEASAGTVTINGGNITVKADDGIQSTGVLTITGGVLDLDAADDAIHGDSDVNVTGGTITISAVDDAIHSEYLLTIGTEGGDGPDVTVTTCNEGFEGAAVQMNSGAGRLYCIDDGVNAANGDITGYDYYINIAGGDWYINADGDGIDSNGDINISGGSTVVYGSVDGMNAAFDYDGNATYTGGRLIAIGNSNMAQTPGTGVYVIFGSGGFGGGGFNPGGDFPGGGERPDNPGEGEQPGGEGRPGEGEQPGNPGGGFNPGGDQQSEFTVRQGDTIAIKDSEGNVIFTAEGVKDANSVLYMGPELVKDSTYTLYINDEEAATATAAEGGGGFNPGGPDFPGGMTKGDVNGDNNIDNVDLVMVARYIVGLENFDEGQLRAADYISDNKVDNVDLVALAMYIVGK